jgi:hypothetical protein
MFHQIPGISKVLKRHETERFPARKILCTDEVIFSNLMDFHNKNDGSDFVLRPSVDHTRSAFGSLDEPRLASAQQISDHLVACMPLRCSMNQVSSTPGTGPQGMSGMVVSPELGPLRLEGCTRGEGRRK